MARNPELILKLILFWAAVFVVWTLPLGLLFVVWNMLWHDAPPRAAVLGTACAGAGLAGWFALRLWLRLPMRCGGRPASLAASEFFRGPQGP